MNPISLLVFFLWAVQTSALIPEFYHRHRFSTNASSPSRSPLVSRQLPIDVNDGAHGFNDDKGIPPRPAGIGNRTFHGSQFRHIEEIGFVAGSPAVEAAPIFLYSRAWNQMHPCYPESAIVIGSNPRRPNPGTVYSPGNPFPVYVGATFCGDSWRINYAVYYVHDGAMLEGHKHDWEGVTVVFKKDQSGADWWYRDSIIMNKHRYRDHYLWGDLETVDIHSLEPVKQTEVVEERPGSYKNHPKVYVGFYSHSAFRRKCNYCRKAMLGPFPPLIPPASSDSIKPPTVHTVPPGQTKPNQPIITAPFNERIASSEYRAAHWFRFVAPLDMHLWSEIDPAWDYGQAVNTPPRNKDTMCFW